jgi:hypothetical protein
MRTSSWPLLAGLVLVINACGGGGQTNSDGGRDGDASGHGGTTGHGGGGGTGRGGSTGGSTAGSGGSTAGAGGDTGGSGGATGGSGGSGGSTAGSSGATGGSGGATGGAGGATAGAGGSGGATAGSGGPGGGGGATAGSGGKGGSTGGSGGSGGSGGATGGSGGATTGGSGGATGGSGGSSAGAGGAGGSLTGGSGGSTAGSGGATGGAGGSGGTSGAGGTVACTSASTCPGADSECQHKTCLDNFCGLDFTAANTPVASQTTGDCKQNVCDGLGSVMPAILDSDTPADDGNACTAETCVNGIPSHPAEPARTACAQSGGTLCNGNTSTPACVVCVAATDCPGTDTICHKRVCGNAYTCGFSNAQAGTAAEPDAPGNCQTAVCDATGGVTSVADNTDVPSDDGNACTDEVCTSGVPSHPAKAQGTACSQNGGSICSSGGTCVQCLVVGDCPGTDTVCRQRTCDATSHTCGHNDAAQGTAAGADAPGNCRKNVCDGAGAIVAAPDDTDLPVDGNGCTKDVCTNGTPSNPNLPAGALCSTDGSQPDGSKVCNGSAACNPITFRVVRIGTGTGTLSSAAAAVFVEERRLDGSIVGTLPLPTALPAAVPPLTMSGSASSEGCLSLSGDGHYLALAGYAATPGTAGVKGTASPRIAGLIDIAGNINTSTSFSSGDAGDNLRAATTLDGVDVWISGAGNPNSAGGIWYNQNGMTTGEVQVVATPNNTRCLGIFGGDLYGSSNTAPYTNVFKIGFGTPTTAQPATSIVSLANMPTTGANPYGFALFDLHTNPAGVDTLYVADDGTGSNGGGGIQKWTFDGTKWTLATTLTISGSTGFRGVAGYAVGSSVTLMASTAESASNRLVVFVNDGAGSVVGTAGLNTLFRGVAVSPHFVAP